MSEIQRHKLYLLELLDFNYEEYKKFEILIELESNWKMEAVNPTTKAAGYFQIIDFWWLDKAIEEGLGDYRTNPMSNLRMGLLIYKEQGISAWQPSLMALSKRLK
jgi:hypothetical protein